eukprot:TRINITY_DN7780_c0_g1_i1.p1 TRINITY_DN7780_c0_g1~~TRINITY_DN7780_c0_g1_i1.p1  ORF type:complete len:243 (+),score=26.42 TRINITY_DN7780_c0_g1_i1:56-730(+)
MSAPFTESVLNRSPPTYDWKTGKEEEKYEGEIYQPPPFFKNLFGYVGYHLSMRADYDENQRKVATPERDSGWAALSWKEWVRNVVFFQPGLPRRERPFPFIDAYERAGFCPENYVHKEWRLPRRTDLNKYIPPPKDGVYEDMWHLREHHAWVLKEWLVYRAETGIVQEQLQACSEKHPTSFNKTCKGISDLVYNMIAKTNVDKVRSILWSGQPGIKDGGFHVRY